MNRIFAIFGLIVFTLSSLSPALARGHGGYHSYHSSGRSHSYHVRSYSHHRSVHHSSGHVNSRSVYVHGYYRKDGTYVHGYHRTKANHTKLDNYSTKGNMNPWTGKPGTVDPLKP